MQQIDLPIRPAKMIASSRGNVRWGFADPNIAEAFAAKFAKDLIYGLTS
jgi:hypothetical protein